MAAPVSVLVNSDSFEGNSPVFSAPTLFTKFSPETWLLSPSAPETLLQLFQFSFAQAFKRKLIALIDCNGVE